MKTTTIILTILIAWLHVSGRAVEPMPNGCRIEWSLAEGDISFSVWRTIPPGTNWHWIINTTNTSYLWTNAIPVGTLFGVSAIRKDPVTGYHVEDIGVAPWPPDRGEAPTNGITLRTWNTNRVIHLLASADGTTWTTLAFITNETPATLSASKRAMMMRASTNMPPLPGN